MKRTATKPSTEPVAQAESAAPPEPAVEVAEPSLLELAQGILVRKMRPRAAQLRRLAEAVVQIEEKRAKRAAKADAKKKRNGKKGKLAKIPGQKKKRA